MIRLDFIKSTKSVLIISVLCLTTADGAYAQHGDYFSRARFAFASEVKTLRGSQDASGSGYLMTAGKKMSPKVWAGMTTMGLGLRGTDETIFRLGVGPEVAVGFGSQINVSAGILLFKESAVGHGGRRIYDQSGHTLLLNWDRTFPLNPRAEVLFGGFVAFNLLQNPDAGALVRARTLHGNPLANQPVVFDRGVAVSMRFKL